MDASTISKRKICEDHDKEQKTTRKITLEYDIGAYLDSDEWKSHKQLHMPLLISDMPILCRLKIIFTDNESLPTSCEVTPCSLNFHDLKLKIPISYESRLSWSNMITCLLEKIQSIYSTYKHCDMCQMLSSGTLCSSCRYATRVSFQTDERCHECKVTNRIQFMCCNVVCFVCVEKYHRGSPPICSICNSKNVAAFILNGVITFIDKNIE